ncbi:MAG: hypothetical protein ABEJ42_06190 [Halobacteriaceae archaeon]
MTREQLQSASASLRTAAEAVGDEEVEKRLYDQSEQLATLATADRGPDHGRLARHMRALQTLEEETGGDVAEAIADALEAVTEYRSTVSGV